MINKLALEISKLGYKGLEWASGIPGTIGGCIYNNAGCYGSEISDNLISVTILNDNISDILDVIGMFFILSMELSIETSKFPIPNLLISPTILSCAPAPIADINITALIPIIIPSMVRNDLIL